MAYSKHIDSYPTSLIRAAEAIALDGITIEVTCETVAEANTLRTKFYGLRKAYLDKGNEAHAMHTLAGKLFATVKDKTLYMMPGNLQPIEAKYGTVIEDAIAAGRTREGLS